jgi:hypothetical protein
MSARWRGLLDLLIGLALIGGFVAFVQIASEHVGGVAGEVYRNNLRRDIHAGALFYSELGQLREFLVAPDGKYSRARGSARR